MTRSPVRPQQVTTGPIQGSAKAWIDGPDGITVPVRRIALSNGEHHDVYDTSGPYTDPRATVDLHAGLPRLREPWVAAREPGTQLSWARAGIVTPEMAYIAVRERCDAELVRSEAGP